MDYVKTTGINSVSIAFRMLRGIISHGISGTRKSCKRKNQTDFRADVGGVDPLFTLWKTLGHRHMFRRPVISVFLNMKAALDPVDRGFFGAADH